MPAQRKKLLSFLIALAIFLVSKKNIFAQNLLKNPGFEEGINSWSFSPSTATFSATPLFKHSGEYGGIITKEKTSSWAYFSQKLAIEADKYYQLSGWVMLNDSAIKNAKLRFYWLDASGEKISSSPVEIELREKSPSFQFLKTELSLSPSSAQFVEVQGYVYLEQNNPLNPAVFDDLVFEEVLPTPTPTLVPIPTPSPKLTNMPSPTLTSSPPKATYKINEVKDREGNTLSNVKIYVDGVYVHHYAPETLTFCDGCKCDTYVDCGFGRHIIELQKTGYQDWTKEIEVNNGDNLEVNPVMEKEEVLVSKPPTPTPTVKPTPTPTEKVATESGEILGEEASESGFYPLISTSEGKLEEATPSSKKTWLPKVFLVLGTMALFAAGFSFWYTQLRNQKTNGKS